MKKRIFAVEDDPALQELYTYAFENDFEIFCFENGDLFFNALSVKKPDIVLLDVMLPGDNGFAVLSQLKANKKTSTIPVIMISAKGDELCKVKGLNLGANDYIAKPFGVLELVARVKANLRKNLILETDKIIFKDLEIDASKHQITVKGKNIQTTLKEYNLLKLFCKNADKVQAREAIFDEIWGESFMGETRTLDIHIKELRKKLAKSESEVKIKTIRGVGYILT